MKNLILAAFFLLATFTSFAQVTSDTATFTRGAYGVQSVFPVNISSQSSCADTLGVAIPSGHWISSIELSYQVETTGGFFGGSAPNDVGTYV